MENTILIAQVPMRVQKKKIIINMPNAKVMQICGITNVLLKYNWHLDSTNNETAVDLELQNVNVNV